MSVSENEHTSMYVFKVWIFQNDYDDVFIVNLLCIITAIMPT